VSNIVAIPKKDNKIKVWVNFRDLNKTSPKDKFPLPHMDVLVDNSVKISTYSFLDGFSGYNHMKMAEQNKEKTIFINPERNFCYKVMSFGLKNDANLVITWSRNPHAKTPIPKRPSKSGLIEV
jgi:hypothetical protein